MRLQDQRIALIARLADELDRRGWRDPGDAAHTLALAIERGEEPRRAAADAPSRFLAINGISRADVEAMLTGVAARDPIAPSRGSTGPAGPPVASNDTPPPWVAHVAEPERTARQKPYLVARLALATVVLVGGSVVIWLGPSATDWKWLLDHPNRLALQALCEASVVVVAAGIATWKWQLAAASGGPVVAFLGLLGR